MNAEIKRTYRLNVACLIVTVLAGLLGVPHTLFAFAVILTVFTLIRVHYMELKVDNQLMNELKKDY